MSRAIVLLGAAILVSVAPTSARAWQRSQSNWNPQRMPVTYYVNASTAPASLGGAAAIQAIDQGMASWSAPSCTSWRTVNGGATTVTVGSTRDRVNTFLWRNGAWPPELGNQNVTIGVTTPVWTVGAFFIDADIQFNGVGFQWNTTGASNGVDAQSIATHEEGHFLGLDHSSQQSAVMFASYSRGLKRTLTSDDITGVCTIYPGTGPVPDAGVTPGVDAGTPSNDPCARFTSCAGCTPNQQCGFCTASGQCQTGVATGPSGGRTCGGGWTWQPRDCQATAPDAGAAPMGTSGFGEPCSSPMDCASGGVCVSINGAGGICSRVCADDCSCPRDYRCAQTTSGQSICVPGANSCTTPADDAGEPPVTIDDAGATGDVDLGAAIDPADGGVTSGGDGGPAATRRGGCGCSAPGASVPAPLAVLGVLGLALFGARRRRERH